MNCKRIAVMMGVAFLALASGLSGQDAAPDTPYFPLKVNTRWVYKVKGQDLQLTMTVRKYEKLDNRILCAVIETEQEGKVIASEYVRAEKDGIYRMQMQGQKVEPPVLILRTPPKEGETWKVESKVMGQVVKGTFTMSKEPVVKVAAGQFNSVFVVRGNDFEAAGQKVSTTYWFDEKIGMVKQEAVVQGNKVELELVKFDAPQ